MTTTTQEMYKQKKSALERIEALESMLPNLIQALGRQIDDMKTQLNGLAELVDTMIGLIGVEKVEAELKSNRLKTATEKAEQQKAHTAKMLAEGRLVSAETVGDNSVLVLRVNSIETGEPVGTGWFRFHVSEIKPEIRETMKGQTVGFKGADELQTFEILEIYDVAPPPAAPAPETAVEVQ